LRHAIFGNAPEARAYRLASGRTTRATADAWRPRLVSRTSNGPLAYVLPLSRLALRQPFVLPLEGSGGLKGASEDGNV
jgi:hypothetical protein